MFIFNFCTQIIKMVGEKLLQDPVRSFTGRDKYKRQLWATDALENPTVVSAWDISRNYCPVYVVLKS